MEELNLDFSKFSTKFGSWFEKIRPFFESGGMEQIYKKLKAESQSGKIICPISDNTFRCFRETLLTGLKVVMMGICPYHTVVRGDMVADGLLMSCSNTPDYLAPSLEQFYGALETEFENGLCLPCNKINDLQYLAEQGVLMFNAALTTEYDKPREHNELWEPFTRYMFEEVFSVWNIPVIMLGTEAHKFQKYLLPNQWAFKLSHPASASRAGEKWDSKGTFKQVNKILKELGSSEIDWLLANPPF